MATIHDFDSAATGGASATTSTISIDVTAGDLIYVSAACEQATTTIAYTDSASNSYVVNADNAVLSHANGDLHSSAGYATAGTTATITITATFGAARTWRSIIAFSVTPAGGTTLSFDDAVQATATSSTPSAGTLTATTAAGFILSVFRTYGARDLTAGTGYTTGAPINTTSTDGHLGQYRSHSSATTYTGDGTFSSSSEYVANAAVFKEVSTGGGFVPRRTLLGVG
jgi:hypothetical protein